MCFGATGREVNMSFAGITRLGLQSYKGFVSRIIANISFL